MHNLRKAKAHNALIINTLQNEAISPEGGAKQKTDNQWLSVFCFAGPDAGAASRIRTAPVPPPPAIPHPGGQGCRNLCGLPFSGEAAGKVF